MTSPAAGAVIRLDGVTKQYRGGGGVVDLSLEVRAGEVFGFLGPNGAGKTTTIRLLLDLIRPDRGSISVLGTDTRSPDPSWRRRVGYLPGDLRLWERLTGAQILAHLAFLRGGIDPGRILLLAERFELDLTRPVKTLSRGNRQKVGIVQALMGDPELLVLDEPTSGLDPLMQSEFHRAVTEMNALGATVLLSSHSLAEVDRLADRVGMIREGRLAAIDEVGSLRSRAVHRIEIRTRGPFPSDALESLAGVRAVELEGDTARLQLSGEIAPLLRAVAPLDVVDMVVREPDLEDIFMNLYLPESETA